ncbi:MAG: hypothetical protein JJU02_05565 [Cryomorphaceae bacterium]|nr:hypothetical protein [Cryomorphaceae bacterium]
MRIQKSTDKEDFGRKGLFRADSFFNIIPNSSPITHPQGKTDFHHRKPPLIP